MEVLNAKCSKWQQEKCRSIPMKGKSKSPALPRTRRYLSGKSWESTKINGKHGNYACTHIFPKNATRHSPRGWKKAAPNGGKKGSPSLPSEARQYLWGKYWTQSGQSCSEKNFGAYLKKRRNDLLFSGKYVTSAENLRIQSK